MTTWGLVATIKADAPAILDFAAHHLDLGAHRLHLFLDAPCPDAYPLLKAHPKIRVTLCDDTYWRKATGRRPEKHQVRQGVNATRTYQRRAEVDWRAHIDVDEGLWPDGPVADLLAALPPEVSTARLRPAEALAPEPPGPVTRFKILPLDRTARRAATIALYADYADLIDDGFMSHVAGKLFLRTGLPDVSFRIHNVYSQQQMNPGQIELEAIRLLHFHAASWQDWRAKFEYRHAKGAYRADLGRHGPTGLTLHKVFEVIRAEGGEAGLRRFFDQVCSADGDHCAALERAGLLLNGDLALEEKRRRHFPQWRESVA